MMHTFIFIIHTYTHVFMKAYIHKCKYIHTYTHSYMQYTQTYTHESTQSRKCAIMIVKVFRCNERPCLFSKTRMRYIHTQMPIHTCKPPLAPPPQPPCPRLSLSIARLRASGTGSIALPSRSFALTSLRSWLHLQKSLPSPAGHRLVVLCMGIFVSVCACAYKCVHGCV
jgi:hypothetical protein